MAQKAQIRVKRLFAAMIGLIAVALVVPTGAWAGSDNFGQSWNRRGGHDDHRGNDRYSDRDDQRRGYDDHRRGSKKGSKHDRYDRHDRHSDSRHHDKHRYDKHSYDKHRYSGHHRDSHRGYDRQHHGSRYFCKPCNHYFSSRSSLYHHVGGHHRIPLWRLYRAIADTAFGLIFHG
jgi:hypothetical protein